MAKPAKWKKAEIKPYKEMLILLRARLQGDVLDAWPMPHSPPVVGPGQRRQQFPATWRIWAAKLTNRITRSC